MTAQAKNTEGFTLSELLLSVAIILALAAIAIPSIVTAQNNMRMVELNNAAESIANAAQTQMTAKKVSGTWLALIEKGGNGSDAHDVKFTNATNVPAGASAADTYFMTANEARTNGIVPSLSIDDQVRNGDYVIEFTASTASVVSVFYTDGKSGFFGSAPENGITAAQTYYDGGKGARDQDSRKSASPMIGYYQGTPAGATDAVALQNPVIWVDESTGNLVITDPNIGKADPKEKADTNTSVVLASADEARQFQITSLNDNTNTITVSLMGDSAPSVSVSGSKLKDVFTQGDDGSGGAAYSIDLNALTRLVNEQATSGDMTSPAATAAKAVSGVLNTFAAKERVTANAQIVHQKTSSIPATAMAYIEWPRQVGKLTVLVTNPYSEAIAEEGTEDAGGSYLKESDYSKPQVTVSTVKNETVQNGVDSVDVTEDNALKGTAANDALAKQNKQAAYQSYTGGWLPLSTSDDPTLALKATIGGYKTHAYQLYELWVTQADGDATRVGYMRNNAWEWANVNGVSFSELESALSWYGVKQGEQEPRIDLEGGVLAGKDTGELGIASVVVARDEFATKAKKLGLLDDGDNVTIYVRTAPKLTEVQAYFDGKAESGALLQELVNTSGEKKDKVGSRGIGAGLETPARQNFEMEFGASSSDVSWVVDATANAGFDQGSQFLETNRGSVRVYYSIAPGLGFNNIRSNPSMLQLRSTEMTNVALWLYSPGESGLSAQPSAMALPYESGQYWCVGSNIADFEIKTAEDYRFYRVLTYYDQDGKNKLPIPDQYVPHIKIDDEDLSRVSNEVLSDTEDEVNVYRFKGWATTDVVDSIAQPLALESGELISPYRDTLSYKGTKLTARYEEQKKLDPSVGMMYIETGAIGGTTAYGFYGYVKNKEGVFTEIDNLLSNDYALKDGGYYLVVSAGSKVPQVTKWGTIEGYKQKYSDILKGVSIQGRAYDCYRLAVSDKDVGQNRSYDNNKKQSIALSVKADVNTGLKDETIEGSFIINLAFACAVETNAQAAEKWGTSDSPWNVRLGRQFIGNLTSNVQTAYAKGNHFLQTHDIDLADAPVVSTSKFSKPFDGSTYDGNDNQIAGLQYRLGVDGGSTGEDQGKNGLFLTVSGNSLIKNVQLVLDATSADRPYVYQSTHSHKLRFGLLVGSVEGDGARVEQCKVSVQGGGTATIHIAKNGSKAEAFVGGLIGYANQLVLTDCSIEDVKIEVDSTSEDWEISPMVGGVIGFGSQLNMNFCTATGVSIKLFELAEDTQTVYFGGLAGRVAQSNVVQGGGSNIVLQVPASQSKSAVTKGRVVGASSSSGVYANFIGGVVVESFSSDGAVSKETVTQDVGASS